MSEGSTSLPAGHAAACGRPQHSPTGSASAASPGWRPAGFPHRQRVPGCGAFSDAGGGTRTPDTRIMMGVRRVFLAVVRGMRCSEVRSGAPEVGGSVHTSVHGCGRAPAGVMRAPCGGRRDGVGRWRSRRWAAVDDAAGGRRIQPPEAVPGSGSVGALRYRPRPPGLGAVAVHVDRPTPRRTFGPDEDRSQGP